MGGGAGAERITGGGLVRGERELVQAMHGLYDWVTMAPAQTTDKEQKALSGAATSLVDAARGGITHALDAAADAPPPTDWQAPRGLMERVSGALPPVAWEGVGAVFAGEVPVALAPPPTPAPPPLSALALPKDLASCEGSEKRMKKLLKAAPSSIVVI